MCNYETLIYIVIPFTLCQSSQILNTLEYLILTYIFGKMTSLNFYSFCHFGNLNFSRKINFDYLPWDFSQHLSFNSTGSRKKTKKFPWKTKIKSNSLILNISNSNPSTYLEIIMDWIELRLFWTIQSQNDKLYMKIDSHYNFIYAWYDQPLYPL